MHREVCHGDALFDARPPLGLYLLTATLAALVAADLVWKEAWGVRLATVAAVLGGARVLLGTVDALLAGKWGADLAVAIAVVAALLIGEPLVAAEVVAIGLVGECLEEWTYRRTQRAVRGLVELFPLRCWRLEDGREVRVFTRDLRTGDRVVVKPGGKLPADGTVVAGRSTVNVAALTGESVPADVGPGDRVLAGGVNLLGTLTIDADRVGEQTVAGRVMELTAKALREKSPGERAADRLAAKFLPVVLSLAAVTFLGAMVAYAGPWRNGPRPPFATAVRLSVVPSLTVLVVACPCALVLATPAAVVAALGRLAGTGVLVKSGASLERLAGVTAFAFDKTGTLTEGRPEVVSVRPLPGVTADDLVQAAATATKPSEHPLAQAVQRYAGPVAPPAAFVALPGSGVRAGDLLVGSARLLTEEGIAPPAALVADLDAAGETPLFVACGGRLLGALGLRDRLRPEALPTLHALQQIGVRECVLLTGDRRSAADATTADLPLTAVHADLLPADKAAHVERLLAAHPGGVAMVGDGLNDAPALARATVGLALGSGPDLAADAGDLVLMGDPLAALPLLVRLSRETRRVIDQNVRVFAFGVNIVGVVATAWLWPLLSPTAAWADAGPLAGAVYHQIGSLAVLLNSMRLLAFERGGRWRAVVERTDVRLGQWLRPDDWLHELAHRWRTALAGLSLLALLVWLGSAVTIIEPDEVGLVRRWGRLLPDDLPPGPHLRWPVGVERVTRVRPDAVREIAVGYRTTAGRDGSLAWTAPHADGSRPLPDESLLMTGDGNLVELLASVRVRTADPRRYLLASSDADEQLRAAAEAELREAVAGRPFLDLLTVERAAVEADVRRRLTPTAAALGLELDGVTLRDLHPPAEAVEAFYAVARAAEERDKRITDAAAAADRHRREASAAADRVVRQAEAAAVEARRSVETVADGFRRWHAARTTLSPAAEIAAAGPLLVRGPAGWEAYRRYRADELAARRQLTLFRLTLATLADALAGRPKVIVDGDAPAGRRHLLLDNALPPVPPRREVP